MTSNQRPDKRIIRSFEDLEVWQEAYGLTSEIYKATSNFPREKLYGLVSQLRRSALSVAANIAEGHARDTTKEFVKFLFNERGFIAETECHLLLARDLEYLNIKKFKKIRERYKILGKRINALINSLRKN